ncbi:MAG: 2Fe-2S iron-sulfur cluster-binding protein, partial [Nocardioides sp.]|nr:2Fe-2S iron-sulfur cluster-binding protein [Nocardioides sp.]
MMDIELTLNGVAQRVTCAPGDSLMTVLRRLGCFSVRYGSETGETGAAAVLVDGRLLAADVLLAAQADGHEVTTVESLNVATGELHPIQAAFVESGALQSGYSAGAMVLATKALLERVPDPSEWEIRDAFSGILDRETGYVKVVDAVQRAAALLRGEKPEPMAPVLVERLTDGGAAGADGSLPDAPAAMPRLVPSADVPVTNVVGKSAHKVDAIKLVKG